MTLTEFLFSIILFSVISLISAGASQSMLHEKQTVLALLVKSRAYHHLAFSSQSDSHIFVHDDKIEFDHIHNSSQSPIPRHCSASSNRSYLGFKANFNSKKSGSMILDCKSRSYTLRLSPPYGYMKVY